MGFLVKGLGTLAGAILGGPLGAAAGGVLGSGLASLLKKKKKDKPAEQGPVPTPTRNMAAEAAARSDFLNKRRGVVANLVMGARGAEASGGSGSKLGS